MQNKGAIKFLAIALAVVCIFQLSFTLVTLRIEGKADDYAKEKVAANKTPGLHLDSLYEVYNKRYIDSIATMPAYNILLKNYTYKECKEKEINLGLDLRGGMNVTLEVSVADIIRNMSNFSTDSAFNKALNNALIAHNTSQKDFVTLFYDEYKAVSPNGKLSAIFSTLELKDKINFESTNDQVIKVIRSESQDAVDRSFNILRTRIDKFGVAQPNIQKLGISGRILIELPGVKDKERVRKLLQGTANLEFWETYDNKEIANTLIEADKKLALVLGLNTGSKDSTNVSKKEDEKLASVQDTTNTGKAQDNSQEESLLEAAKKDTSSTTTAVNDSLQNNVNPLFEVLQPMLNRTKDGYFPAEGPAVGIAAVRDTAKVMAYLNKPQIKSMFPRDLRLLWTVKPYDKEGKFLQLVAIKVKSRDGRAPLAGNVITDASGDFAQNSAKAEVSMSMNAEGAETWRRLTKENIGKSIAIVLDDYVYSFPTVQGEIGGGRSSITGNFDITEAKDLANILKAGKMPARARIVQEDVVGPTLGQEAINAGLISFVLALIVVLLFMGFYYHAAGWVADIALIANVFFIMGILSSLGAVLTLPGVAGIVLTIGLAVDANILIFERVREELARGKSTAQSIKDGYKHAMSSIIDANVTLAILAIILMVFGSGPVQGFATTLLIGIITSLFSAIFISRLVFDWMLERKMDVTFDNKFTRNAFKDVAINFVGHRKLYYSISSIIIVLGTIMFFVHGGFKLGVDFKGGRTYNVRFEKEMHTDDVKHALRNSFEDASLEVKTVGGSNQMKITTSYRVSDNSPTADSEVENALYDGLNSLSTKYELVGQQKVGPTIATDILYGAYAAILFSCLLMFFYIVVRFKKWQFGLGAVVALFHDVLVVLSFYTILEGIVPFSLEIGQDFIAAILTVMGYTMTETVIVFDRIRERLNESGRTDIHAPERNILINYALNSTLSRTILTSLTVFFVLIVIFIFGGDSIRGFIFALLIGRIIGTYSSLCISTPIVVDFYRDVEELEPAKK